MDETAELEDVVRSIMERLGPQAPLSKIPTHGGGYCQPKPRGEQPAHPMSLDGPAAA